MEFFKPVSRICRYDYYLLYDFPQFFYSHDNKRIHNVFIKKKLAGYYKSNNG